MAVSSEELMSLMDKQAKSKSKEAESGNEEMEMEDEEEGMEESATPMAAPMSTPEPKMGSKEGAMVNLGLAMDLIKRSLPAIGADSAEGRKALDAIKTLTAIVGERKDSSGN